MTGTARTAGTADRHTFALGAQYLGAAAVWGASFLFIKVAVEGLSPAQVVLGRLSFGALTLALIMLVTRRRWPRGLRVWSHLAAIGALMCVAPFLLFSWAAQYLPSALSSIFNATTPIATMLVALALLPEERLTRAKTSAFLVAAAGVVLVAAPWEEMAVIDATGRTFLLAQLACLGGTTCYGLGFSYTRRFLRGYDYDATTVSASQIGAGAIIIVLLTPFVGTAPPTLTVGVVASVITLGAVGTGLAYIWYTNVIDAWGATIASTVTYLTPIGGVLLGVAVLGESVGWNEVLGGGVIVLGVLISQGRLGTQAAEEASEAAPEPSTGDPGRTDSPGQIQRR